MKIIGKKLISVSEADIVDGKFVNKTVTEVADNCFYNLKSLRAVSLPKVKKIGNWCFRSNQALTEINLRKKQYSVKDVDGFCFVVERYHTSKGIKIYSGYNILNVKESAINKQQCYVAEKDGFYAHGETIKAAISDVQFKIVADRLKNEPIEADTDITVDRYRAITGACNLGVRGFMEANKIPYKIIDDDRTVEVEPIKAKYLLPLLRKSGAYGLEKFESLLTF